jgi:hypothetical protein
MDQTAPRVPESRVSSNDQGSAVTSTVGDTLVGTIVIDPSVNTTYQVGQHRLWVKAGALCDLGSAYGPEYWNAPCVAATAPVSITAKAWTDASGRLRVDFSPDVRFYSADTKDAAVLYFRDKAAAESPFANILYCNATGCVDESKSDPTLVTQRDKANGWVYRRILHFSGYLVAAGRSDSTSDSTSSGNEGIH